MNTGKIIVYGILAVILALAFTACKEEEDTGPVGNLEKWTAVTDNTFGEDDIIKAIACGNEGGDGYILVAGGTNGKMAYSWDGIEWTAVADSTFFDTSYSYGSDEERTEIISTYAINAIAYGSDVNRFVAVGENSKMAYSDDGIRWTAVANSLFAYYINTVAYGNGVNRFVAGGTDGKMAYSDDGVTWTAVADSTVWQYNNSLGYPETASINAIAYGNGKFVAVGSEGKMAYSTDGENWTAVTNNTIWQYTWAEMPHMANITGIAYGNGKWVAGSNYHERNIAYSANGENWTAVSSDDSTIEIPLNTIASGGGRFVASSGGSIAYSTNGINWTYVDLSSILGNNFIYAVAYDGNYAFIVAGSEGKMAYAYWPVK